jgi:precorrin-6B methylase 2
MPRAAARGGSVRQVSNLCILECQSPQSSTGKERDRSPIRRPERQNPVFSAGQWLKLAGREIAKVELCPPSLRAGKHQPTAIGGQCESKYVVRPSANRQILGRCEGESQWWFECRRVYAARAHGKVRQQGGADDEWNDEHQPPGPGPASIYTHDLSFVIRRTFRMTTRVLAFALILSVASVPSALAQAATTQEAATRRPDVIFVPTPEEVVEAMLQVANVTKNDIVYDLGSGDGRIPVTAAKKYGARAVGIDIDPQRIKEANENVAKNNVGDKVKILNADLFTTDISEATVVTLYLLPSLNVKLMPKLMKELKPGTRIVSHAFDMGDWKPEKELDVNGRKVYFWTIPKK